MEAKDILRKILEYSELNINELSGKLQMDRPQALYDIQNGKTKSVSKSMADKILSVFPEFNRYWLITGEGDMLKLSTEVNNQKIKGDKNQVFQVKSIKGDIEIQHHSDEGKDRLIETQERQVINMFSALLEELKGFHEIGSRRDDRIKEQDKYIARIIKHSYLRNDENMKRMDELIRQQNEDRKDMRKLIEQNNDLIIASNEDRKDLRKLLDRILSMLENKLNDINT